MRYGYEQLHRVLLRFGVRLRSQVWTWVTEFPSSTAAPHIALHAAPFFTCPKTWLSISPQRNALVPPGAALLLEGEFGGILVLLRARSGCRSLL